MLTAKQGSKHQWKPIETPYGQTEFGTRNQAHADYNAFKSKHKKFYGKEPEEIKFSERYVTKKIKGEKHEIVEYKAILRTSISFFKGKFIGISLISREDAMKKAIDLANEKFPKSRKASKKEKKSWYCKKNVWKIQN